VFAGGSEIPLGKEQADEADVSHHHDPVAGWDRFVAPDGGNDVAQHVEEEVDRSLGEEGVASPIGSAHRALRQQGRLVEERHYAFDGPGADLSGGVEDDVEVQPVRGDAQPSERTRPSRRPRSDAKCVARVEEDAADAQARQRTDDRGEAWAMLSL
jgi:hypothetical protein